MADEAGEEDMSDLDLPESSSGKQKRSTKAIWQQKLAAGLERLQALDTTYLTGSKRVSIHKKIKQAQESGWRREEARSCKADYYVERWSREKQNSVFRRRHSSVDLCEDISRSRV